MQYQILYQIISPPDNPIFIGLTDLDYLYDLSDIEIPSVLNALPIECRFILLNKEGDYIDSYYKVCFSADVKRICREIPLKMFESYKEK